MAEVNQLQAAETSEAGIFTWDITTDTLYGDSAVAKHFGLDPRQVSRGLPLDAYLQRVHLDDRAGLVKAIMGAVETREPYHAEYRTLSTDGEWLRMMAFGRCFFASGTEPSNFSGLVYPVPLEAGEDESLIWHLLAAHSAAKNSGSQAIARAILRILSELGLSGIAVENDGRVLN